MRLMVSATSLRRVWGAGACRRLVLDTASRERPDAAANSVFVTRNTVLSRSAWTEPLLLMTSSRKLWFVVADMCLTMKPKYGVLYAVTGAFRQAYRRSAPHYAA